MGRLRPKPSFGKWFLPSIPKTAMGFVVFDALASVSKRGTDMPPDRSEWQELVVKRSRSLFNLFGRCWFRSYNLLRLSINKFVFADLIFMSSAPHFATVLELLQSLAHVGRGVFWVLQTGVKGPGLPFNLRRD